MSEEELKKLQELINSGDITMEHIGVQNVAKKLRLLYPQDSQVEIVSVQNIGTRVSLIFPYLVNPE